MTVWLNPNYTKPKSCAHKVDGTEAQNQAINAIAEEFDVRKEQLEAIVKQFQEEIRKGLRNDGATVAMIPSFVSGRPTGEETGRYLALDLGGTNLRVCEFSLEGNGKYSAKQQKFVVSEDLKRGEFRYLCDYIADCVDTFITEHGSLEDSDGELQLGFTFSFPVWQTEINRGVLKQWTKGFSCPGAVNKDVTIMLQDAFRKKNIPVHIAAIVNDTVGTLMAYAYSEPSTAMGVIMGTGSNASYYEKMSNLEKWSHGPAATDEMVINMEWGAFDCERRVLPFTIYDNKLDRESINVGQQLYEKMISGMYLGEITRNCMLQLIDRYLLFNGQSSQELNKQWSFETAYMSAIECDDSPDLTETKHILESTLNIPSTTLADRQIVKKISNFVGRRAARLSACGLSAVMSHTGALDKNGVIAIDGSLFEFYPNYENNMRQAISELYDAETAAKFKFALARDGSGLGAAIIAMIAHKDALQKKQQKH